ncbi:hypothetical protein [Providencia sp. PROV212]|uniref:hypothetical protein n=1 Tax=Providencia sp. PROV212 TaxID=2949909 RepID=UPI00234B27F6|nr:hypothetical protein [Providencia sp. PROV212]
MSYVILECGSVARGDTNIHSDRDLVCIWSGILPNYSHIEKTHGETMFYSIDNITRMRKKGSLFLTHLDIDSKYLDGNIKLLNVFKGYRPQKKHIRNTQLDTITFIKKIHWYPDSLVGEFWLCDVLYVALRNFIYCKNALSNCYLFGYEDAIKNFSLTSVEYSTMLLLREAKYLFRSGRLEKLDSFDINNIEKVCHSILGQPINFFKGGSTCWDEEWKNNYWSGRFIERAILNNEFDDDTFLEKIKRYNYNKYSLRTEITEIVNNKTLVFNE